MTSFIRLVCILIYTLLIVACGGDSEEPTVTTPVAAPAPAPQPTPAPEPAPDNVPPVIVLNGGPTITLEFDSVFNDPGATATDDVSGTVGVTASNPNTEALSTQQIVYTAVDAAGNSSSLTRQLIVQETAPPEINLVGEASVTIELGEGYVNAGALANGNYDGLLEVSVDSNGVDFETLGTYNIRYTVSDTFGNTSVT